MLANGNLAIEKKKKNLEHISKKREMCFSNCHGFYHSGLSYILNANSVKH